ncbi:NnrU family protein [Thalassobaculum sp. OXR-137]|uniref:NnrU family protein n=1 Tax=Thalassobaculum sp. OXR-137 TaxID=3100173 RepID=UPI002AC9B859|nr:NnrU family protein [Thalassobaculum sp. OXR-137]WPZ35063.1 NnrU family protein [Thalassobaculum sp. OXR-137]
MLGTIDAVIIGVLVFTGGHFLLSSAPIRDRAIDAIGEEKFRGLYSLVMLGGLVWLILAFRDAPYMEIWVPGAATKWVPNILVPIACILLVSGITTRSPTSVGGEAMLAEPTTFKGILTITRHPFLWGTGLWSLGHLATNGDLASILLFGGIAVLSFAGMPALDAKIRRKVDSAWGPVAMTTSILPFLAVLQGRTRLDLAGIGWWRLGLGVLVWVLLYGAHPYYAGVWPHPG